jgi:hypothetical protein
MSSAVNLDTSVKPGQHWKRVLDNVVVKITEMCTRWEAQLVVFKFNPQDEVKYCLHKREFLEMYELLEDYHDGKQEETCCAGKACESTEQAS